jgi:hypothetical protein
MSENTAPRLDLAAEEFADLTLAFDAFHRGTPGPEGVVRVSGRRFLRCNLTGPAMVTLAPSVRVTDCIFSACAFTALPDGTPAPGSLVLEDCTLDDCVLTRWSVFVPPLLLGSVLRDMPRLRVYGLPFG